MTITEDPTAATPLRPHWTSAAPDSRWLAEARSLADELADRAPVHDREGSFVQDGFDRLRAGGFLSMLVPTASSCVVVLII